MNAIYLWVALEQAKKYIYENTICEVSDIAKHCLLSESGLYNVFKKESELKATDAKINHTTLKIIGGHL